MFTPSDREARQPEIAIIGGGPAGAAAGRMLARCGHRVLLVARTRDPARDFTESLPPSTHALLSELGVLDAVQRSGCIRTTGNTVWWGAREGVRETFEMADGPTGYQVFRPAFDRLMLEQAADAGVEIHRASVVQSVRPGADGIALRIAGPDGLIRDTTAQFVLDASGRAGTIARHGWRRYDAAFRGQALIGLWKESAPRPVSSAGDTLVESSPVGWGWSCPSADGERHVGILVDAKTTGLQRGRQFDETYLRALTALPQLSALLTDGRLLRAWACDASVYDACRYAEGAVLLAGDAGSFIEPLSSFGVKKALASGWTAAVALRTSLRHSDRRAPALDFFNRWERRVFAAARNRSIHYAREAEAHHAGPFWAARAAAAPQPDALADVTDDRSLLTSPEVRAAYDALRLSGGCVLAERALRLQPQPIIVGHEIEMQDALVLEGLTTPLRFVCGVDLLGLLDVARGRSDAGAIVDAYLARHRLPVPEVLSALAFLLARGVLRTVSSASSTQT
jgi:flavin-dependent dehydrogenase